MTSKLIITLAGTDGQYEEQFHPETAFEFGSKWLVVLNTPEGPSHFNLDYVISLTIEERE